MGSKEYCLELFKNSQDDFMFWSANDVRAHCGKIQRSINQKTAVSDKCAAINDAIFAKYHLTQNEVFQELSEIAAEAVQKKRDKEKKLKLLMGDELDENPKPV